MKPEGGRPRWPFSSEERPTLAAGQNSAAAARPALGLRTALGGPSRHMIASVAARATLPGALQPGKADRALMQAALVEPWYKLHVLTPEQAGDGVCLDGSPPGFFYSPPPLVGGRNDSWLLHLDGGGWCTDLEACKVRSKMFKGTSTAWKLAPDQAGILNTEAARNPTFHGFHKAVLKYCDGASFSGDVQDPVKVGNTRLYFRAPRVLN